MIRALRSELRRLWRPLVLAVGASLVGIVLLLAAMGQETAASQYQNARDAVTLGSQSATFRCESFALPPGEKCDRARAQLKRDQVAFLKSTVSDSRVIAATQQHWTGSAGVAGGLVASLLGAICILLVAAGHVGGEWTGGTIKNLMAIDSRRWRFVLTKILTVWIIGIAFFALTWGALIVFNLVSRHAFALPHGSASVALDYGLPRGARAVLVIGVFAVIGVIGSIFVRSTLGGFLLSLAFVVFSYVAAGFEQITQWTAGYWIGAWMGFHRDPFLIDHVWPHTFGAIAHPSRLQGFVGLTGLVVVATTASLGWMRTRDV